MKHSEDNNSERIPALALNFCTFVIQLFVKMKDFSEIITIESGKRGGKPTIRGMRITVGDILNWLASGMTVKEILADFDELTEEDVFAALNYAASRERGTYLRAV